MKKTATNTKKALITKEQQKISSYFSLTTRKKSEDIKVSHELPDTSNRNNGTKTDTKSANKNKQNSNNISPNKNNHVRKACANDQDDFNDNDFKETKKEKIVSNILHSSKTNLKNNKHTSPKKGKVITTTKCNKENKSSRKISTKSISNSPPLIETQNKTNGSNNEESLLIVDLDQEHIKKSSLNNHGNLFGITPEKTFMKQDDVDITENKQNINSIDSILSNKDLIKSNRTSSPPHSTPQEKCKKRKLLSVDSPDIIPPTPQDLHKSNKSRKSKLCIENKFSKKSKSVVDCNEPIIPDMIVKSPPRKKRRSSDSSKNKTIINLSNISANEFGKLHALSIEKSSINKTKDSSGDPTNLNDKNVEIKMTPTKPDTILQSTSKFKVTPIKSISPSTKSLYNGNASTFKVTPTKSKRVLFGNELEFSKDSNLKTLDCPEDALLLSANTINLSNGQTKTAYGHEQETCKNGQAERFELDVDNKKICVELGESNYIISKFENTNQLEKSNEDNLNDLVFDDNWDEEIVNIQEKHELNLEDWTYCQVSDITKDLVQNLIVKLHSLKDKSETICSMEGIWQNVKLQPGDVINIMAVKSSQKAGYFIDNNNGFLVFEPDLMVSPTSIVGFKYCNRRGILQEKFRGFDPENRIMIVGTLVHKLLEEVLRRKFYTPCLIEKKLIEILKSRNMINTLYSSQISLEGLKKEVFPFIPKIVNFINKYIIVDKSKAKHGNKNNDDWRGVIHSISDIEENIWCPQLGIKGKVDITVSIDEKNKQIVPLELKTGRATMSLEHRGQIILYIMMMNELGFNVSSGLLLYLREEKLKELSTNHREKRDLLMMRNEFAYFMKQRPKLPVSADDANFDNRSVSSKSSASVLTENDPIRQLIAPELPEPIDNERACTQCPYALICTAFLSREKSCESLPAKHPLVGISNEMLAHLNPAHIDYFLHWTSLISLENSYKPPMKELKDIWRLEPYQREQRSKSICYLNISERVHEDNDNYIHTFKRTTDIKYLNLIREKKLKTDLTSSGLVSGNYVVISIDTRVAIATGFILSISENSVTVALERNLTERYSNKLFHIDTYESVQILNFSMTSVAALIQPTERAKRLRELIIDKVPSIIMSKIPNVFANKLTGPKINDITKRLNTNQIRAVLTVIAVEDYFLIKGMPGTGKTATIVALIQVLVLLNKSVLITSHTHSSVDNVCLRLLDSGVNLMRLGTESRIHPQLKHRSENVLTAHCKNVDEITEVYNKVQVIAVTCLAAGHPLLSQRKIDVCIVDESTQVLQCSLIKALISSKVFVLIGDPDQLPPVVKNPEAVRRGMNESLFERLDNPISTITLTLQYRMNQTITALANAVTYRGQLLCANDDIGLAILNLPKFESLITTYGHEHWIMSVLNPQIKYSVIAINTGPTWNKKIHGSESDNLLSEMQLTPQNVTEDEERRCSNHFEAAVAISIIKALKQAEVPSSTIGVIAPYRAQVELLKQKVAKIDSNVNGETVEVNTVDQYQGRDKDVIIYSCTRSRDISKVKNNTGFEILDDKRRLTVAITRAKHKLIVIGDFTTLKEYSPFNKLISSLQDHQILDVNDKTYNFDWSQICVDTDD